MDPRVEAIRNDERVGRGSCTTIDEAMTDDEIIAELDESGIKTPKAAVKWAHDMEGLQREKALNQRWGDDDDPQLKSYNEWYGNESETDGPE